MIERPEAFERIWRRQGERVCGTHLFPLRFIGELVTPDEPYKAAQVVDSIPLGGFDVIVTWMSGLFVRVPPELSTDDPPEPRDMAWLEDRHRFISDVADALNLLICELTLLEVISEPASPLHIAPGVLADDYVAITTGGGGRETYHERTLTPTSFLFPGGVGGMLSLRGTDGDVLAKAAPAERALRLAAVAESLPVFVAAAYSLYSHRLLAEALLDAWIVVEQVLNHLWVREILPTTIDNPHRDRLDDHRTFSAAVKTEILMREKVISGIAYQEFQRARKHRNGLAHGAKVSRDAAQQAMVAMREAVEIIIGETPPWPLAGGEGVVW